MNEFQRRLLLSVGLLASLTLACAGGRSAVKMDIEDGESTVTRSRDDMTKREYVKYYANFEPTLETGYWHALELVKGDGAGVLARLVARSNSWKYLKCHGVTIRADDMLYENPGDHDGDVMKADALFAYAYDQGHEVIEAVLFPISDQDIAAMASARETRVRVCDTIMVMSERQKKDLAKFARATVP